ncbi:hypothetical protein BVRB_9g224900 [Beta vulgaris subsp. vulgaris]|uniref:Uncharacterized protein n=1 Tax=Beta vulgaris subsp. vulgaris TaxID=3555 RepID=A0A0J8B606_BETVV|nr:uncharacterized protein LOC104883160 [Beta vulgaris subsp. vulgaris]KMS96436.1 hypothetical protein BVRB_9g224900 [Beta vulgaris subsp. vulgaris]
MAYDLSDPLVFIGSELRNSVLQGFRAPAKDAANPRNISFTADATITIASTGSAATASYNELKVFGGTIKGASLDNLIQDLRNQNLRVNRDGYCYIRIPGTRLLSGTRFLRLNDLFPWDDYVDDLTTYNPEPSSTIWNRVRSNNTTKKVVDYEKLDADLKKANNDNATLINENNDLKTKLKGNNDADVNLKKAKDEIDNLNIQVSDLNDVINTMQNNWYTAATIRARPLPPNTFNVIKVNPRDYRLGDNRPPSSLPWMGGHTNQVSEPVDDFNDFVPRSYDVYISTDLPYDFDINFWWVIRLDMPSSGPYGYMMAYYVGRHDRHRPSNYFNGIASTYSSNGFLDLDRIGYKYCFMLRASLSPLR